MDIKQFVQNFADQFDNTDASVFTKDTVFWDLDEWSSLIALSEVAMIDEEYGVSIKSTDIKGVRTIEDLFNVVKEKSQE